MNGEGSHSGTENIEMCDAITELKVSSVYYALHLEDSSQ